MRYPTKIDGWIKGVMIGAFGLELAAAVALVSTMRWAGAGLAVLSVATFVGILRLAAWPVSYEVTDVDIRIRCGVWGFEIPIGGIVRIYPSRNPLSAPAWSLDRLQIEYVAASGKKRMALISPPDREAFLADVAARDRGLRREGDRLVR